MSKETLDQLQPNERAVIELIKTEQENRKRLQDLGFVAGYNQRVSVFALTWVEPRIFAFVPMGWMLFYLSANTTFVKKERMNMIHITLPDGSVRTFEQEQITPLEVAKNISNGLAKKAIVAKVNGNLCSLGQPITVKRFQPRRFSLSLIIYSMFSSLFLSIFI